ncbi:MAG: hypothetical protein WCR20_00265 [Verrucomicrobiota bacterium]
MGTALDPWLNEGWILLHMVFGHPARSGFGTSIPPENPRIICWSGWHPDVAPATSFRQQTVFTIPAFNPIHANLTFKVLSICVYNKLQINMVFLAFSGRLLSLSSNNCHAPWTHPWGLVESLESKTGETLNETVIH